MSVMSGRPEESIRITEMKTDSNNNIDNEDKNINLLDN